jgi:Gas vesicle synthesis protein GvpO
MAKASEDGRLSAAELGQAALTTVEELTGYQPEAVTGLEWDGELWRVTVDALEMSRIPNTTDVLGEYEIQLDDQGTLRGYRRTRRFVRGQSQEEG